MQHRQPTAMIRFRCPARCYSRSIDTGVPFYSPFQLYKKMPPGKGGRGLQKLLVAVLALLVSHAAGGLASGLAGSLALAAAAGLNALSQVTSSDSLNTFHNRKPL